MLCFIGYRAYQHPVNTNDFIFHTYYITTCLNPLTLGTKIKITIIKGNEITFFCRKKRKTFKLNRVKTKKRKKIYLAEVGTQVSNINWE